MHNGRFIWVLLVLMLGVFSGGCASIEGTEQPAGTESSDGKLILAVLPFHGVSEARGSGLIVADTLANQLYALGKYAVITPELVTVRLLDRDSEALAPGEAGALVGARYVLTGRVTEYTYKSGVGETPAVGVTIRLIDAPNGTVLWSATRAGVGGGNWFQEESLSQLTLLICRELADALNAFLQNHVLNDPDTAAAPVQASAEAGVRQ